MDAWTSPLDRFRELRTLCQHDMRCSGGRHVAVALIAQRREIESVREMFAGPEQSGRDRDVELVDEGGLEVLADCRDATTDLHVLFLSGLSRALQRLMG